MNSPDATVAVVGDCHGHLQLALAVVARWQCDLGAPFDAVFLCGDVGTFTEDAQLDNATRRHGKANPCELEFLTQWSTRPPAPWLGGLFRPEGEGGLGMTCPVVMVHGNHEGFAHLATLEPPRGSDPLGLGDLAAVDPAGRIRYLPSGRRVALASGHVVAGVGGIERGQRQADYHPMAYLDDDAVARLLDAGPFDLLLTHQGPAAVQGVKGSPTLQLLLDAGAARVWFHGHSTPHPEAVRAGPIGTLVVPLGDVAFPGRGPSAGEPGPDGWALARLSGSGVAVEKVVPPCLREFRRSRWVATGGGLLVCPPLARGLLRDGVRDSRHGR